jgi:hypothetical protein
MLRGLAQRHCCDWRFQNLGFHQNP